MNTTSVSQTADKSAFLERIFPFLVQLGLENVSIRELCKGTGIVQGSLYYWFGDKTNIVCEATEYGLKKVTKEIFEYVLANAGGLRGLFSGCLDKVDHYKDELRFIYQMAASPFYGETVRELGKNVDAVYDRCTNQLAEQLGCDAQNLRPLVYLFISAVLDYAVWDEREKSQMQLEFIYSALSERLAAEKVLH